MTKKGIMYAPVAILCIILYGLFLLLTIYVIMTATKNLGADNIIKHEYIGANADLLDYDIDVINFLMKPKGGMNMAEFFLINKNNRAALETELRSFLDIFCPRSSLCVSGFEISFEDGTKYTFFGGLGQRMVGVTSLADLPGSYFESEIKAPYMNVRYKIIKQTFTKEDLQLLQAQQTNPLLWPGAQIDDSDVSSPDKQTDSEEPVPSEPAVIPPDSDVGRLMRDQSLFDEKPPDLPDNPLIPPGARP